MTSAALKPTPLRVLTETTKHVVVEILVHGPVSRADLARGLGWSPASMTRITKQLVDAGIVVENISGPPMRTGRPALPLDVDVDVMHLIGINLTGGAMTLVRTDLRAKLLDESVIPIEVHDPEAVADLIAGEVNRQLIKDPTVGLVGISLAGPISPFSPVVRSSGFLGWHDVPLVAMIEQRTGLTTMVDNDVRALTAAEHWFGAAAGVSNFALVTVGMGVGCGIVVDNQLIEGSDGGSGHVGHLPISQDGPLCERGHRGCVRSYLSSTLIVAQIRSVLGRPELSYQDVLALAANGNPVARRVIDDAGRALGQLIGTIASINAPSKVLISGEGVGMLSMVEATVQQRAAAVQHWSVPPVPIEVTPFAWTEWARGAAVLGLRRYIDDQSGVDDPLAIGST